MISYMEYGTRITGVRVQIKCFALLTYTRNRRELIPCYFDAVRSVQLKCNNIAWLRYPMLTCQRRTSLQFSVARRTRNSVCSPIFLMDCEKNVGRYCWHTFHCWQPQPAMAFLARVNWNSNLERKILFEKRKKMQNEKKIYIWNDMINMRMGRICRIRSLPSMRIENVRFFKYVCMYKGKKRWKNKYEAKRKKKNSTYRIVSHLASENISGKPQTQLPIEFEMRPLDSLELESYA